MDPSKAYHRRKAAYESAQAQLQQAANRLSNERMYTILLGFALAFIIYRTYSHALGAAAGLLTLILFGYLAYRHGRVVDRLRYAEALHEINRTGIERAAGRWSAFAETGAEFRDDEHPFASDLDLFGQGSLFQWINSAQTALGRESLAGMLGQPPGLPRDIAARQEAVAELGGKLAWRQHFQVEGLLVRDRLEPTAPLVEWAGDSRPVYLQPPVKFAIRALPALTILMVALYFIRRIVPWPVPVLLLTIQGLLLFIGAKARSRALTTVYRFEASLGAYARMLQRFESPRFRAGWLSARQERLRDTAGRPAYAQVRRLSVLAERISNRENAMFMIVNLFILWDYQCLVALEEWRRDSGKRLRSWLETIGEIEALASLANIRFEHPDWAMPEVVTAAGQPGGDGAGLSAHKLVATDGHSGGDGGGLSAHKLGHPLIAQDRVCNDFELTPQARIAMITGSNMSGKSTFLRTVGINLVLAYCGAPVCAADFRCSVMALWTSMRVSDNLEQNVSSFYAELLRIKRIVDAARSGQPVCFLLDEIFKGTNSYDRHLGAKALITQLQRAGAYGLASTHDLELGELERASNGGIRNYHFREYYQGREIRFDYTLRPGISTTRNALYLIRMVGIDLEPADGRPATDRQATDRPSGPDHGPNSGSNNN